MRKFALIGTLTLLMLVTILNISFLTSPLRAQNAVSTCPSQMAVCDFKSAMRKLWSDHVSWTRMYVISAVANLEDTRFVADRLLRNQDDIGNAIKPFYGDQAGDQLAGLLRQHILLAVDLVNQAKAGNKEKLAAAEKKWFANADDIATALSTLNPNLPKKAVTDMLYKHLRVTEQEVTYRLNKNYNSDIAAYDQILKDILAMSDEISEAIIKQFPDKFAR